MTSGPTGSPDAVGTPHRTEDPSAGGTPVARTTDPRPGATSDVDLRDLLRAGAALLAEAGVASPDHDARAIAAHVLDVDRGRLVLHRTVPADAAARYAGLIDRRRRREPLQHLLGRAPFRHVELAVGPGVFVPRPETEQVAEVAVDAARAVLAERGAVLVVDLCTGSGAIALAVASEVPGAVVHAVELDPQAATWAARNLTGSAVELVVGDATDPAVLGALDGSVDVVVSNPPYVPPDAVPRDPEVRDHDPDLALYGGGADGLDVPARVVARAAALLRPGGLLVVEHAEVQAAALRALVEATGAFTDVRTARDLTGRDRMVLARRTPDGPADMKDSRP